MSLPFQKEELVESVTEPHLPVAFDDFCKSCGTQMERMHCHYHTRQKPFATFQCPNCEIRLFLIEAPITPLLVWSNQTRIRCTRFSEYIDEVLAHREQAREIRKLRYGKTKEA
jgi:hypothetical protein